LHNHIVTSQMWFLTFINFHITAAINSQ